MWWLGQQITLEFDSRRVIDRFLEAVVDIAHADSSVIGMLEEDGRIRFVVGTGLGSAGDRLDDSRRRLGDGSGDANRGCVERRRRARRNETTSIPISSNA